MLVTGTGAAGSRLRAFQRPFTFYKIPIRPEVLYFISSKRSEIVIFIYCLSAILALVCLVYCRFILLSDLFCNYYLPFESGRLIVTLLHNFCRGLSILHNFHAEFSTPIQTAQIHHNFKYFYRYLTFMAPTAAVYALTVNNKAAFVNCSRLL